MFEFAIFMPSIEARSRRIDSPVVLRSLLLNMRFRFWPQSRRYNPTMRTLTVIFVLALITIAFEVYSDAALTRAEISQSAAPDDLAKTVASALERG